MQKYMRRLPKTHKKLSMRKQDEPNFYKMDKLSPLPPLQETPATILAMRRQAMAQASAINAGTQPYASLPPPASTAARLPVPSYAAPGYPSSFLSRQAEALAIEQAAAAARFGALEQPPPSLGALGAASLPPTAAASLPAAASLRASLGMSSLPAGLPPPPRPPAELPPPHPLDLAANPSAAQQYQARMRHLQHLQLFQRQMGNRDSAGAPSAADEELLRQYQAYGGAGGAGSGSGRGRGRPPFM